MLQYKAVLSICKSGISHNGNVQQPDMPEKVLSHTLGCVCVYYHNFVCQQTQDTVIRHFISIQPNSILFITSLNVQRKITIFKCHRSTKTKKYKIRKRKHPFQWGFNTHTSSATCKDLKIYLPTQKSFPKSLSVLVYHSLV